MHLWKQSISYFSVPKCGNTSVKAMMFQVENGFPFRPFKLQGERFGLHKLAKNVPFAKHPHKRIEKHTRFTVVRDPLERVVSFYSNKVLGPELAKRGIVAEMAERGLATEPSVDDFIMNLEAYRSINPFMQSHLSPLSYYAGTEASYFDRVFRMSEMDELPAYLEEKTGQKVKVTHLNKSKSPAEKPVPSAASVDHLREMFKEDYENFGAYF